MLNLTNVICPSFKNVTNRAINNLTIVLSSVQSVLFLNFFGGYFRIVRETKIEQFWLGPVTWPDNRPVLTKQFITKTIERYPWTGSLLQSVVGVSTLSIGGGGDKAGKQLHFTTTRRVREEDGRSPDTRLEGHLGRRQARDDSLIAQHMPLPIEGWTAIKVFVMLWSW